MEDEKLQIQYYPYIFLIQHAKNKRNMTISAKKHKCMTILKYPLRCKIKIDEKLIKHEMKLKNWRIDITYDGDVEEKI